MKGKMTQRQMVLAVAGGGFLLVVVAVAYFGWSSLSEGGILQNVTTTQRDNPERVDGKTEQVALKFAMRAEWPVGGVPPVEAAKKPANP